MLVLLDRDGVINRNLKIGVLRLEEFEMLPGAAEAIGRLTKAGFRVAICTNQSAVGRGQLSEETLEIIHARLMQEVSLAGGRIDAVYFAPDIPEQATNRRKPGPGMLLEALAEFHADPARTPFVGDHLRDMQAAKAAGCPRILVRSGHGAEAEKAGWPETLEPLLVVDDLPAAVTHILQHYAGA